ncbi:MAG: AAA family ATPase [Floccifex sp.]
MIILDEIQNAPKVLESLKYFCEDANEYHVMAAGSLLGVALHKMYRIQWEKWMY